jgi:hypothetical protein
MVWLSLLRHEHEETEGQEEKDTDSHAVRANQSLIRELFRYTDARGAVRTSRDAVHGHS